MKKSKWFLWGFVPYFNFGAWIHAGIRTGRNRYYWLAAFYGIPFTAAVVIGAMEKELGLTKETIERITSLAGSIGVLLWLAGILHTLVMKRAIDQQIQAYDENRMPVSATAAIPPPPFSHQTSKKQPETVPTNVSLDSGNVELRTPQQDPPPAVAMPITMLSAKKTYKYIDAQGALIGPATLASLQALKRASIVSDTTQVLDDETKKCLPLGKLLAAVSGKHPNTSGV